MAFLVFCLVTITSAAVMALGSWIAGRILLPEMGLTAPAFVIWFWAMFILVGIRQVLLALASWTDD